jgi:putative transcriptional regulator
MISHHPHPDLLADCARGALNSGAALVVATHVHSCAVCREETSFLERVGGALLYDETPVSLSGDAFERALKRLDLPEPAVRTKLDPQLPPYLDRFAIARPLRSQKIGRRLWVTPNIWFASVTADPSDSACTYLVYARPRTRLSLHTHVGREFTTVLHGAFRDGGSEYRPGDFAEADGAILHAPAVTAESDCLCLISADAPMHLTGRVARAIQAMTGRFY